MSAPNPGLVYMIGHYDCHVVVHHFPIALVQSWLPPELELMPQDISPPGFHPANLLFGLERHVDLNITALLPGFSYNEFGLVLPYVRWKNAPYAYNGPFLYTPIIFVSEDIIAWGGDLIYGFPKRVATFSTAGASYSVMDQEVPMPYVQATFNEQATQPTPAARETITRLLQQPSVSKKANGEWFGSGFWWNIDTATLTDVKADGRIIKYLLPAVPDGEHLFAGDGTSQFANGAAYKIVTDWTLTLPGSVSADWSPWNRSGA
jgi:hypothetical protein